tara:strand:- start:441 stop:1049 length:609 start_codon:yes stop_codon:yes gene_type:complete
MAVKSNGTTLIDAGALDSGVTTGDLVLITTVTASSSATLDFTSSINSTYKEYHFKYINIHPASVAQLTVNFRDGGSDFDATKTTTALNPYHNESDNAAGFVYRSAWDLAQSTSDQIIAQELGNGSDEGASGFLHLYEPSSTSKVKHFFGTTSYYQQFGGTGPFGVIYGGYCNTTTAIDGVRFKMSSGNIDSGTIKMYGVKPS